MAAIVFKAQYQQPRWATSKPGYTHMVLLRHLESRLMPQYHTVHSPPLHSAEECTCNTELACNVCGLSQLQVKNTWAELDVVVEGTSGI